MAPIRALWHRIETIHAVTYFAEEARMANEELGLEGWMGYFATRAAPLGAVPATVVQATFANFAPGLISTAIPRAWTVAEPAAITQRRREAAADALRWAASDIVDAAEAANDDLARTIAAADPMGRPLFSANAGVSLDRVQPEDPVEALWQHCTTLREHRGDSNLHALSALGLRGLESLVLAVAAGTEASPTIEMVLASRGWTVEEWDDAVDALVDRELVSIGIDLTDGPGTGDPTDGSDTPAVALTPAGAAVHLGAERTTDALARRPFTDAEIPITKLIEALDSTAKAISAASIIGYPNPIGLPPV